MTVRNYIGYLLQTAAAALLFTPIAIKFGLLVAVGIVGVSLAITGMITLGISLSMDTRQ